MYSANTAPSNNRELFKYCTDKAHGYGSLEYCIFIKSASDSTSSGGAGRICISSYPTSAFDEFCISDYQKPDPCIPPTAGSYCTATNLECDDCVYESSSYKGIGPWQFRALSIDLSLIHISEPTRPY